MLKINLQKKKYINRPEGDREIRVNHVKHGTRNKKSAPCYRIRCGCCDEMFDIFYGNPGDDALGLEINGVHGSLENWREIFLPILRIERQYGELVDISDAATEAREILAKLRDDYDLSRSRSR